MEQFQQCFRQTAQLRRRGQFSPLLLQGCMQAWPGHSILIAIPRLKIVSDMVTNELTIYNATSISFLATKTPRLVAIMASSFLHVEDQ